jgi:peptidyl-dipeptidase A
MKAVLLTAVCLAAFPLLACDAQEADAAAPAPVADAETANAAADASPEDAAAFLERAETTLADMAELVNRASWIQANFITYDSNFVVAELTADWTETVVVLAQEARRFDDLDLPLEMRRKLTMLKAGVTLPAPTRPGAAQELADISTRLNAMYGEGKIEMDGEMIPGVDVEELMGTERDPARLAEMWTKWHEVAVPMKEDYVRLVELANEGARELGYADLSEMWLSNYDMSAEEMRAEVERLWTEVSPLYDALHCYVRAGLSEHYGPEVQPETGPIRADLLGNMWAQQWGNIYDIVAPEGGADIGYDVTELLEQQDYTPLRMVETAEGFFTSLGFEELPNTFWERSLFEQPQDREVVCHASAWDLDDKDDLRIKMCTKVNADDFQTVHHELGHNFYQRAYKDQDPLFRTGAHDGFHEAIGDFVALSITPDYLAQIGLIDAAQIPPAEADTGLLLYQALDKIAFLPFGLLVDKWRWQVFSGELTPETYNDGWVALREQYQGVTSPTARPADAFDPGAKYHIPGNTPYLRYFLAFVLQFQFHKAACDAAGWDGPLHRCSVYGSPEVGEKLQAMLEAGASQPWPDTLELFTGTREMDGSAIIEYFTPLMAWLEEQNAGRQCGW